MGRSFRDSLKLLEADIQHANSLASEFRREYDGACLQMRMSYCPAAHLFLFLVQWTDCNLAGALGLLRILIYKVYADGTTTMSTHERKASIREFYAVIYPSLAQLHEGINEVENKKQKAICVERYRRRGSPSTTTFVRSRNSAPSSHLAAAALSVDLDSNRRLLSSCQQICFGVLVSSRKAMVLRAVAARLASSSLCHHHVLQAALLAPTSTSPTAFLHSQATSFGYKQVREDEKSKLVGSVFSSVASSYDVMNDLMSGGLHRLWKDRLISKLNPFPGMKHLDVAGGTGDVAFRVVERIKSVSHRATQGTLTDLEEDTHIYVCDINPNMLDVGKKRAAEKGYNEEHCLSWVQGDAEALSFDDGSMDGYTIAFGIRNVTHIEKALSEAYRVLKKGGRFLCLELSHVDVPIFKDIYDVYSFSVIPAVGELVAGDRQSYQYLVESIRRFPKQEKFAQMIQEAGFERVEYENLVGGVVAIHSGLKL